MLQYLKGFSLQKLKKTPDFLEQAFNYFDDNFGGIIKKLVNAFTNGLEAIGFSPVVTSRYFYAYFKEITVEPELKTPEMWIYQRFRPFIQLLLVDEWINFLADTPGNVIDKLPDFNIITPEVFEAANATRGAIPKVTQLVHALNTLRFICQDVKQMEEQLRFERVEENLQSLYFLAQLLADMGELKRLNVPVVKQFLLRNRIEWTRKPTLLSASAPSAIRCAVFLSDLLNIDVNLAPIFDQQIETVRRLVETTGNPLKTNPYELYYALLTIASIPREIEADLSGLLQQLAFTIDILEGSPSLPRLGIIFEVIFLANPTFVLPAEIQDQISAYLQRFWTVDGFLADIKDDTPNPIATYFGFAIRKRMGLLQPADLAWFFHFFIGALEHANKTIDYAIPETIANVLHCKKFFNAFEMEPDFQPFGFPLDGDCLFMQPYVKQLLECPNPVGGDIIRFSEPDKVQQDFQVGRQVVAQEVAQLLREPKLIFKKPVLLPKPPVEVNPFAFLNPVEEAKREGKISQNGNMEDILEEMGTSVGNLGNVLSAVKAPGRDSNSQKTAEPVTNGNPQPSQKTLENEHQGSPERQGKTDARGKPTNMALLEEQLALDTRREKLKEWIIRAMPTATKFQVEADVEEILKLEKTHQLDVYLDYLRREKRVDTKDFPAT